MARGKVVPLLTLPFGGLDVLRYHPFPQKALLEVKVEIIVFSRFASYTLLYPGCNESVAYDRAEMYTGGSSVLSFD